MKFHLRSRAARRKAALRRLDEMNRGPQPAIADESSSPANLALLAECTGRPYLIGPGTFLVATYLQRMQRDAECAPRDKESQTSQQNSCRKKS